MQNSEMCVSAKKHNKNDDKNEKIHFPKLRFSEFTDPYIETELSEISNNAMYGLNSPAVEYDGENKYIRITDIDEDSHLYNPKPISSPGGELDDKFLVKKNDILFARTGASTGKSYIYNENDGKMYFAGFLIRFNIDKADAKYVYYQTLRKKYVNWVSIMSVRSGQPGINLKEYEKLKLNLPSIEEQKKVSSFLSLIDKKIGLLEEKQEVFKKYKKEILKDTFSKKSNSEKIRISDLGSFSSGYTFKPEYQRCENSEIPFFKVSDLNLNKKYMKISNNYINKETCDKLKYKTINKPSIIFAKIGEAIYLERKRIAYPPFLIDNNLLSFQPSPEYSLEFIYYIFQSLNISRYAQKTALPSLPSKEVGSIECYIPSSKTSQRLITDFLIDLDKKNSIIEKNIMLVKNLKEFLLQNLFI